LVEDFLRFFPSIEFVAVFVYEPLQVFIAYTVESPVQIGSQVIDYNFDPVHGKVLVALSYRIGSLRFISRFIGLFLAFGFINNIFVTNEFECGIIRI